LAKDHFIPASLIARFSEDSAGAARSRKVWALRANGSRAEVRAESIGYSNRLYDVDEDMFPTHGARAVDDVWGSYEPDLSRVLDRLIDGSVTAAEWIDVLVPFVAASFARDRGYQTRVKGRLSRGGLVEALPGELDRTDHILEKSNIAINRVMEMERFAARALACSWVVHEVDDDLVLQDVGYGFELVNEFPDVMATLFPVGRRHVLMLTPCPVRWILTMSGGEWRPVISHVRSECPSEWLNRALANTAQDFVVGSRSAVGHVEPGDLRFWDWDGIDQVLEQWPFGIDTRLLSGLHRVVRAVVHGGLESLDEVCLNRYQAITDLEPKAIVIAPRPHFRASRVLKFADAGLALSVEQGF
jgi:hypothetical protein